MPRAARFNYGICINTDRDGNGTKCPLCESKEPQKVMVGHDFVCSECGEPLHKIKPPKTFWEKYGTWISILGSLIVIGAILAAVLLRGKGENEGPQPPVNPKPIDSLKVDTLDVKPEDTIKITDNSPKKESEAPKKTPVSSKRTRDLGYATWTGRLKNGLPDDENGTMTFKESHLIDSRDPQKRLAEKGDYIIGEYSEGKLVQGVWYDKSNHVKGSIIIGR